MCSSTCYVMVCYNIMSNVGTPTGRIIQVVLPHEAIHAAPRKHMS